MKDPQSNNKVMLALLAFESIKSIRPDDGWNQSLIERLQSTAPHSSRKRMTPYALLILVVTLLNIGLVLRIITNDSQISIGRNARLEVITNELLVHETDSNY
jgi:hypothetical protein